MPVYVYRTITDKPGDPEQTFEVFQSIHDAPLTHHPETGAPVRRVLHAPMIGKGAVSNTDLKQAGFTKYKKTSDGNYEKIV